jgi:hypothetical protein
MIAALMTAAQEAQSQQPFINCSGVPNDVLTAIQHLIQQQQQQHQQQQQQRIQNNNNAIAGYIAVLLSNQQ